MLLDMQPVAILLVLATGISAGRYPEDAVDEPAASGLANLKTYLTDNHASNECTFENAARRHEWGDLSIHQRKDYINAVLCLHSLPPKHGNITVPEAKSRFDDFCRFAYRDVRVHTCHGKFPYLAPILHTWVFEKALHEECEYRGYQPYWDWVRYAADPINSPIFSGNAASLSGNGLPFNYFGLSFHSSQLR